MMRRTILLCIVVVLAGWTVFAADPALSSRGVGAPPHAPPAQLVIPRGGVSLADVMLGQSGMTDFRGHQYLFFVLRPEIDNYVSGSMLSNPNGWEDGLNKLFDTIVREKGGGAEPNDIFILDVGANLGAFSLHVAATGCCKLLSFEMQPDVYRLLELSRRVNSYHNMRLINAALWDTEGVDVSFSPVMGNFGGTGLRNDTAGSVTMKTARLDSFLPASQEVFFMKIDVENSEHKVLKGLESHFKQGLIRHLVMETRANQADIVEWFYDLGFVCSSYNRKAWERQEAVNLIRAIAGDGYADIYCELVNKA